MTNIIDSSFKFLKLFLAIAIFYVLSTLSAFGQQMPKMHSDSTSGRHPNTNAEEVQMSGEGEIAHPFFTHMGVPEAVGTYSLRVAGLASQMDGVTKGDLAFHFETGLSDFVGLHIRNDRFLENTHSEIMFQFAAIRSADGMSGFSPIIEFEFPTKNGASGINTLVGFSTALVRSKFSFNQVLHFEPKEEMLDGSASLVYRMTSNVFLAVEVLGEKMPEEQAIVNLLIGAKLRLTENFIVGIGYMLTITSNHDLSSQYIFQPDVEWKRR